jgi:hypothetical protein
MISGEFQKRSFTGAMESRMALASWGQTLMQDPQAMHLSATTLAWPSSTLMAFAGHFRTQV